MTKQPTRANDEYSYPLHMTGTASGSYSEEADGVVKRLHEVVREVTGKGVEQPVKPRIGFLP
jgi:hypothetical protein